MKIILKNIGLKPFLVKLDPRYKFLKTRIKLNSFLSGIHFLIELS